MAFKTTLKISIVERRAGSDSSLDESDNPERSNSAEDAPDGGLWAWLQVLGASLLFFNSWYVASMMLVSPFEYLQGYRQSIWRLPSLLPTA